MKALFSLFLSLVSFFKSLISQPHLAEIDQLVIASLAPLEIPVPVEIALAHEAGFSVPQELQPIPGLGVPDHPMCRCTTILPVKPQQMWMSALNEAAPEEPIFSELEVKYGFPPYIIQPTDYFTGQVADESGQYIHAAAWKFAQNEIHDDGMRDARMVGEKAIQEELESAREAVDVQPFFIKLTQLHQACQMIGPSPLRDYWQAWAGQPAWDHWVEGVFHEGFYTMIQIMEDVVKSLEYDYRREFFAWALRKEQNLAVHMDLAILQYCQAFRNGEAS